MTTPPDDPMPIILGLIISSITGVGVTAVVMLKKRKGSVRDIKPVKKKKVKIKFKTCPYCGNQNGGKILFCTQCGYHLK